MPTTIIPKADLGFYEHFLKPDIWAKFSPMATLGASANQYLMGEFAKSLKNFFDNSPSFKSERSKVRWLIFSLWDHYRHPPRFNVVFLTLDRKLADGSRVPEYVNPYAPEEAWTTYILEDGRILNPEIAGYKNPYSDYVKWWAQDIKNKFVREVHFWDFLHSYRHFQCPVCIVDPEHRHLLSGSDRRALVLETDGTGLKCWRPDWQGSTSSPCALQDLWSWGRLDQLLELQPEDEDNKPTAQELLTAFVTNYYKYLGGGVEGVGAPFLYELPMVLDVDVVDGIARQPADVSFRSAGALSIGATKPLDLEFWEHLLDQHLRSFFQIFLTRSFFERASTATLRAAVAAIMARNMSHNIGSHVMPRATLEATETRMKKMGGWPALPGDQFNLLRELKGRLDEYVQRKSDFLAEVTTQPLMATKPAWFVRDCLVPLLENGLFMDNIAANEGFRWGADERSLRVEVRIRGSLLDIAHRGGGGDDGCACEPEGLLYPNRCQRHKNVLQPTLLLKEGGSVDDVEVELPGPLGEFALYGLLENFIRNAAKHGHAAADEAKGLTVSIEIDDDKDQSFYRVLLSDSIASAPLMMAKEVQINGRRCRSLEDVLKAHLRADLLEPSGEVRKQGWGIAEMKICSLLLSGSANYEDLSSEENLSVVSKGGRLHYSFRLMKARKALLVGQTFASAGAAADAGYVIAETPQKAIESLADTQSPASFRFALFEDGADLTELASRLPFRTMTVGGSAAVSPNEKILRIHAPAHSVPAGDLDALYLWLWKRWTAHLVQRRLPGSDAGTRAVVHIYLQQSLNESPTNRWLEVVDGMAGSADAGRLVVWANDGVNLVARPTKWERGPQVVFDRHCQLAAKALKPIAATGEIVCYQALEKASPDFSAVFSPSFPAPGRVSDWSLPWELAEAGLLRIALIDERAAEVAYEKLDSKQSDTFALGVACRGGPKEGGSEGLTRWHVSWAAGVFICTDVELTPNAPVTEKSVLHHSTIEARKQEGKHPRCVVSVGTETGESKAALHVTVAGSTKHEEIDLVFLHQGLLDRWSQGNKERQVEILSIFRRSFPYVVVESGRGIPPTLPDGERFLPFSVIQQYLLGPIPGKVGLTRLTMPLSRLH